VRIETDIGKVIDRYETAIRDIPRAVEDELVLAGEETLERVRAATPVDTGALRDAWGLTEIPGGCEISNPLPYATDRAPDPLDLVPADVDERVERRILSHLE
jgi:hypothetical protein